MANPRTGRINQEWIVESISGIAYTKGGVIVNSAKHPYVSEAVLLSSSGTLAALSSTIVAHDRSLPDQGSIASTLAATLKPQQFLAGLYGVGGSEIGTISGGTINGTVNLTFLLRGR